jgi:hypothetical protein
MDEAQPLFRRALSRMGRYHLHTVVLLSALHIVSGDAIALTFILEKVKESGTNELLYVFSESDYGYWSGGKAEIKLQCYSREGTLEWENTLRTSGSLSASNAVKRLLGKLEQYVSQHLGEACLSQGKSESKGAQGGRE